MEQEIILINQMNKFYVIVFFHDFQLTQLP